MRLSLDLPIDTIEIDAVNALSAGHPVFKLSNAQDRSCVVIKQEMVLMPGGAAQRGRKEALRFNVGLMHAVDTDARTVVMTKAEVDAVKGYVEIAQNLAQWTNLPLSQDVQSLSDSLQYEAAKWVKMAHKQIANLDDALDARIDHNKTGVRQFAAALNAPGGLEKLGEILAVDLFNDNGDRFSIEGGIVSRGLRFDFLVNVGNVLLSSGQLSGLDSWDPGNRMMNTRQRLYTADANQRWGGLLLRLGCSVTFPGKTVTRDSFAEGVISDLEKVLGPRKRAFLGARTKRLDKGAKARLLQGMTNAVPKIRTRLRGMGPLPPLVADKTRALGWNPV